MDWTKKECILVEAAKAFARFGFKKASVDEIAKKAGVAKGTVYLAADSKEDLFYQVLHRELRSWIAECSRVIDHRTPADRLLAELLDIAMAYLETRPLVRELLFGETSNLLPAWADRLDDLRTLGRQNLIEVLRLGVQQKLFRADLDVETAASVLQDMNLAGHLFHHRRGDPPEIGRKRAQVGLGIVLDGLRARPTPLPLPA